MASLPTPDTLASAAANLYDSLLRGGVADLRRTPATLIEEGPQRSVYRYLAAEGATPGRRSPVPLLLVPPLAAPATCFDLRRSCSVAEHLVGSGRRTYLVDYGEIEFGDRGLGLEHWIDDVIPTSVRTASEDSGGLPVQLVGWCLGGIMALLAHCADRDLPIASIALVGSPFDFTKVPLVAPLRPIDAVTRGSVISTLYRALGGAPAPLVQRAYMLAGIDKYVMKPYTIATNLHRRDLLAQIEAVDVFMHQMRAYPGRTFGQLYHRFFRANDLADGSISLGGRRIVLADARVPLQAIAGEGDGIAPVRACHALAELVPDTTVDLHTAPGGHLGVLTGRAAKRTTWPLLDAFLARTLPEPPPAANGKPARRRARKASA